jgi:hypothetical protein
MEAVIVLLWIASQIMIALCFSFVSNKAHKVPNFHLWSSSMQLLPHIQLSKALIFVFQVLCFSPKVVAHFDTVQNFSAHLHCHSINIHRFLRLNGSNLYVLVNYKIASNLFLFFEFSFSPAKPKLEQRFAHS